MVHPFELGFVIFHVLLRSVDQVPWKKKHKKESEHQLWQEGFHPKQILSDEMLLQKVDYPL